MADNQDEQGIEMMPTGQGSVVENDNDDAGTENTENNNNAINDNTQGSGVTLQQINHNLEQGIQPGRIANAYPLSPAAQFFENLNYICMFISAFGGAIWAWGFFPSLLAYPKKTLNIITTILIVFWLVTFLIHAFFGEWTTLVGVEHKIHRLMCLVIPVAALGLKLVIPSQINVAFLPAGITVLVEGTFLFVDVLSFVVIWIFTNISNPFSALFALLMVIFAQPQ